jgi:cytidylate kinase
MCTYIKKLQKFDKSLKIKKKGPTIAVGGLSGSGKTTVAESIAKATKLKLVNSGDIFRQLAKERKMKLEEFSKACTPEDDYEIDRRALKLAKQGNVVLVGRVAAFVAGDYADWKIFVDCPLEIKTERVAKREHESVKKARKQIISRDKRDAKRYKRLYGINDSDTGIYDIIINTGHISKQETIERAKMIAKFLVRK